MKFNEDSRVKIPTILHLTRLGYEYQSLKGAVWDVRTNIFPELFKKSIAAINPEIEHSDIDRLLDDVKLTLENEDLGQAFYEMLPAFKKHGLIIVMAACGHLWHVAAINEPKSYGQRF